MITPFGTSGPIYIDTPRPRSRSHVVAFTFGAVFGALLMLMGVVL